MSTPFGSSGSAGRPEMRISDAEREAAATALGEHYAAGRLTKEEYDERAAVAYAARTASALRPLFTDLPAPHPFAGTASARGQSAGSSTRPQPGAWGRPPVPPGRRPGFRLPLVPILFVLIGLSILFEAPWLIFVGLGILFFTRSHRRSGGCGSSHRNHTSRS